MNHVSRAAIVAASLLATASVSNAQVIFENLSNNGFFTPFTSSTPAGTLQSDGYWCSPGGATPITGVSRLTLGLASFGGSDIGTTDIDFTFAIRDPSGLQFGPTTILYTTTITGVQIPASPAGGEYFDLVIPLPNLTLNGNFNDFGFSVGVRNFDYDGSFGFQCSVSPTAVGFSSFLASQFNPGSGWFTYSFGGEASFVAKLEVPSPGVLAAGLPLALMAARRRR